MAINGSVTEWLVHLKDGNDDAAQKIWERYFASLIQIARSKLGQLPTRDVDELDVVSRVMENVWFGVQAGRFPKLNDRSDLWQILLMLVDRRAIDAIRKTKNFRKHVVGESTVLRNESTSNNESPSLSQFEGFEPTPEFVAETMECYRAIIKKLEDPVLMQIANWKFEGYSNQEISTKLDCVERTVERKLKLIRERISV